MIIFNKFSKKLNFDSDQNLLIKILLTFILFGILVKFYDLSAPWKRKEHYNYGGSHTEQMIRCMNKVPFKDSRGVPLYECNENTMHYYTNHPPTINILADSFTKLVGVLDSWSLRLFAILFSILNLFLLFKIACVYKPESQLFPYLAVAFQSLYFFGMYYGSHLDFISEFALTPVLISVLFMLKGNAHVSGFFSVLAGVFSWPGFLNFAGLIVYSYFVKKVRAAVILWTIIGAVVCIAMMMWLQNEINLLDFFYRKLVNQGYLQADEQVWYYPVLWFARLIQNQSRNFGAALFLIFVFELFIKIKQKEWNKQDLSFYILLAGCGSTYLVLGRNMFFVHGFLYIYLIPAIALLSSDFVLRVINKKMSFKFSNLKSKIAFWFIVFAVIILYPYGANKNFVILDVLTSILTLGVSIYAIRLFLTSNTDIKKWLFVVALSGLANASQMINVRSEPSLDYNFCKQARIEFATTGKPVKAPEHISDHYVRRLYCDGIPIE